MNTEVMNFLYEIVNSRTTWILLGLSIFICFAWEKKRNSIINVMRGLLTWPVIFHRDPRENPATLYPRIMLENIAQGLRSKCVDPFGSLANNFKNGIKKATKLVHNPDFPLRTLGSILFCFALVAFIFADAIAILNTLNLMQFIDLVPALFQDYSIAVTLGSIISFVIGAFVLTQILAKSSAFTGWSDREGTGKEIAKMFSIVLTILGIIVVVFMGLERAVILGWIPESDFISNTAHVATLVLVPLNTVIATFLIFEDGLNGILAILIFLLWPIWSLLIVINFLIEIFIGNLLPFLMDVVIRALLFVVYVLFYFIITPIDFIIWLIKRPFEMFKPNTSKPQE